MKAIALGFVLVFLVFGCKKKEDLSKNDQRSQTTAVAPDNSGRNERDRNDAAKIPGDQSESEADRTISQNIRKAVTADSSLSTNGKNVKIITVDGVVTLRGPVKSEAEKTKIESRSKQIRRGEKRRKPLEILTKSKGEYMSKSVFCLSDNEFQAERIVQELKTGVFQQ